MPTGLVIEAGVRLAHSRRCKTKGLALVDFVPRAEERRQLGDVAGDAASTR
jgi:hypothetical protein